MNDEKEKIIALIEQKMAELNRLNIREGCFADQITHLNKCVSKIQKRKQEIHDEIEGIRQKVLAWENNKQQEA